MCGGHAGIETRALIAFSEANAKGRFSLQRFVEVTSSNAARLLGMYPQKGAIAVDSDADIVLWDPTIRKRISVSDLHHESDYSIREGWEVRGWPVVTVLRGRVIVEHGKLFGSPSDDQWLKRKVASDVLSQPVC